MMTLRKDGYVARKMCLQAKGCHRTAANTKKRKSQEKFPLLSVRRSMALPTLWVQKQEAIVPTWMKLCHTWGPTVTLSVVNQEFISFSHQPHKFLFSRKGLVSPMQPRTVTAHHEASPRLLTAGIHWQRMLAVFTSNKYIVRKYRGPDMFYVLVI